MNNFNVLLFYHFILANEKLASNLYGLLRELLYGYRSWVSASRMRGSPGVCFCGQMSVHS